VANSAGNPVSGNGTSFSNPNMAGLVSCLWQAFPEFNNMKIIDALQKSASRFTNPDERFGYGIPDMRKAFYILKTERNLWQFGPTGWFRATPDPFDVRIDVAFIADNSGDVKLVLKNAQGSRLDSASFTCDSLDYKEHAFINLGGLPAGVYFVQYKSATKDSTITLSKGADLFARDWIKLFPNPVPASGLYVYFTAQVSGKTDLALFSSTGQLIRTRQLDVQKDNIYSLFFSEFNKLSTGVYIVLFDDGVNKRSFKVVRN
jgi:hypothetical protein